MIHTKVFNNLLFLTYTSYMEDEKKEEVASEVEAPAEEAVPEAEAEEEAPAEEETPAE